MVINGALCRVNLLPPYSPGVPPYCLWMPPTAPGTLCGRFSPTTPRPNSAGSPLCLGHHGAGDPSMSVPWPRIMWIYMCHINIYIYTCVYVCMKGDVSVSSFLCLSLSLSLFRFLSISRSLSLSVSRRDVNLHETPFFDLLSHETLHSYRRRVWDGWGATAAPLSEICI